MTSHQSSEMDDRPPAQGAAAPVCRQRRWGTPTITMADDPFVIVGASLAGAKAAQTLREEGFDGRVVLIGAEPERPYERPPLSKDYLRGEKDERPYVHDEAFYAENDIELRTGTTVEAIDPGAHTITVAG